jgi:cytosine/adenosine deaminase-related metal-dependent hydrolase
MARAGLLEGKLTCAHGVWLEPAEMETLARHDVTLSHNPASNLMLGSGTMDIHSCASCGLRLALGCDSANTGGRHDLFGVMRLAMMLPRPGGDFATWPTAPAILAAATEGGAASLGLANHVGRIVPGLRADLLLLRAASAGTLAAEPTLDVLVHHGGPEHVDSVMIDGAWVLRSGRILAFDEPAVIAQAQYQAAALRERVAGQLPTLLACMPDMEARFRNLCLQRTE